MWKLGSSPAIFFDCTVFQLRLHFHLNRYPFQGLVSCPRFWLSGLSRGNCRSLTLLYFAQQSKPDYINMIIYSLFLYEPKAVSLARSITPLLRITSRNIQCSNSVAAFCCLPPLVLLVRDAHVESVTVRCSFDERVVISKKRNYELQYYTS
jgi:hypothetical protein